MPARHQEHPRAKHIQPGFSLNRTNLGTGMVAGKTWSIIAACCVIQPHTSDGSRFP